jgi:hypothetical protein
MKGLSLNLGKSGTSLSIGGRGASINIGKNGTFLNTGVPGTGLSNRVKIGGNSNSHTITNSHNASNDTEMEVRISLDERGAPILKITTSSGIPILDPSLLRKIKASDKYKESVKKLMDDKRIEIEGETDKFINIVRSTPVIIDENETIQILNDLRPEIYETQIFNKQKPTVENVKSELEMEAKERINSILFWQNKKRRADYVAEHLNRMHDLKVTEWTKESEAFLKMQQETKTDLDTKGFNEYIKAKTYIENIIEGNVNYINQTIEEILKDLVFPIEFAVDFKYFFETRQLKADLYLPPFSDMPKAKVNTLSTGKISIKNKTEKELRNEYATCVCGMAIFFAGVFFNISTRIIEIIISGNAEVINKATGNLENQYIYSVKFERDKFKAINFENVDPLATLLNFPHELKITQGNEFKTVTPLLA